MLLRQVAECNHCSIAPAGLRKRGIGFESGRERERERERERTERLVI
jgi:hypothetical protein